MCASLQHIPLHLVALKFTHKARRSAAFTMLHRQLSKNRIEIYAQTSRGATAVPRYIAPPHQPRRRMKIAIRLALLPLHRATYRIAK